MTIVSRLRSYQTPRLSLVVLLLGLGLQAMARNRMQAASVGGAAVVATIDSALAVGERLN